MVKGAISIFSIITVAVEFLPAGGGREVETFRRKDDKGNVLADEGGEQWKLQQFTGSKEEEGKWSKSSYA